MARQEKAIKRILKMSLERWEKPKSYKVLQAPVGRLNFTTRAMGQLGSDLVGFNILKGVVSELLSCVVKLLIFRCRNGFQEHSYPTETTHLACFGA